MSNLTANGVNGLMEAYAAVYTPQQSLEEEIFEAVAYTLISQGYDAIDVLEYFANVDEEIIIEDIISIAEGTLLVESIVPEEYLQEQYEILNEALPAIAAGLGLAGRALLGAGARRTAGVVLKRMAGPGVRKFVGGAVKNIGGAVGKVKDLAKGALNKLPGGSGGKVAGALKTAGKWALGGAAFEAGSRGVKALMGDKNSTGSPKVGPKIVGPKIVGPKIVGPAGASPGPTASTPRSSNPPAPKPASKPAPSADNKLTNMQKWAKANPKLAAKVKLGQSGYDEISATRTKPGPNEKQDQTPTQGPSDAKIDPKAVSSALKAQQERDKKKAQPQTVSSSYEYDAYDLVLEYLLSQGHADTLEEANYVMLEMDAEMIGDIVEVMTPPPIMPPPVKAPSNTESKNKKKETGVTGDGKEGPMGGPYTEAYTTPGTQNLLNKRNPDSLKPKESGIQNLLNKRNPDSLKPKKSGILKAF
jgi:hypothetical protein